MKKIMVFVFTMTLLAGSLNAKPAGKSYKDGAGIGVDVFGKKAAARIWLSQSVGVDVTAGLAYSGGDTGDFGFNIGGGLVFPFSENGSININILPGINFNYTKTYGLAEVTYISFIATAGIEMEIVLSAISENLCVASVVGAGFGINSSGAGEVNTTNFSFGAATDMFITPVILRYYF